MSATITPAPGLALIRRIQTAETYAGSAIIIPEQARDKVSAEQFEVVSVGVPEPCDDEDCERAHRTVEPFVDGCSPEVVHPCDLEPGDWVLCRKRSWMATPDPDIFVIRCDDVLARFVEQKG